MKTAESAIKELISRIENAKVESRNPNNRTKRTGEYRIGLSQAINLAHDVIAELAEELASHPCPVEYPEAIIANFQPTSPMSAEQVEELGYYYPLFKFFSDEHGLSLLDSQLQDVIHECKKFIEPASPSVKADGWVSVDKEKEFHKVLKCLKNNKVMVDTREDGIYIRLAGRESEGEAFTLHFALAYPFPKLPPHQNNNK